MVEPRSKEMKLGTPQYFHSGVRMLLHASARGAEPPTGDSEPLRELPALQVMAWEPPAECRSEYSP